MLVIKKKALTAGELRKALEGVPDDLEVQFSSDTGVDQGEVEEMKGKKIVHLPVEQYLNDKEHAAYMEDFTPIVNDLIDKLVGIADKYNVDRDNAVQHFSVIFKTMVEISTFQDWEKTETPDGHLECSVSGDADMQCSMCGEQYTADGVKELAEMGEPFQFYDGKFLCPDCYDEYSRQTLEDQFETALSMREGE